MTPAPRDHSVVAIYGSHAGAEAAIQALHQAGLDMRQLSIVGRGLHPEAHALGFYTSGDHMRFSAGRGALWGSLWGMLLGSALFFLPVIGPIVVMGPLVGWIAGAVEGAAVGGAAGALAAALATVGLPTDCVGRYELELKAGRFLLLVHGSAGLIERARNLLGAPTPPR